MKVVHLLFVCSLLGTLVAAAENKSTSATNCSAGEYLDTIGHPPVCRNCTVCSGDRPYQLVPCSLTEDGVCSLCPAGNVWSEVDATCYKCGKCCNGSRPQTLCIAAGLDVRMSCLDDARCHNEAPEEDFPRWGYWLIALGCMATFICMICVACCQLCRIYKFKWQGVRIGKPELPPFFPRWTGAPSQPEESPTDDADIDDEVQCEPYESLDALVPLTDTADGMPEIDTIYNSAFTSHDMGPKNLFSHPPVIYTKDNSRDTNPVFFFGRNSAGRNLRKSNEFCSTSASRNTDEDDSDDNLSIGGYTKPIQHAPILLKRSREDLRIEDLDSDSSDDSCPETGKYTRNKLSQPLIINGEGQELGRIKADIHVFSEPAEFTVVNENAALDSDWYKTEKMKTDIKRHGTSRGLGVEEGKHTECERLNKRNFNFLATENNKMITKPELRNQKYDKLQGSANSEHLIPVPNVTLAEKDDELGWDSSDYDDDYTVQHTSRIDTMEWDKPKKDQQMNRYENTIRAIKTESEGENDVRTNTETSAIDDGLEFNHSDDDDDDDDYTLHKPLCLPDEPQQGDKQLDNTVRPIKAEAHGVKDMFSAEPSLVDDGLEWDSSDSDDGLYTVHKQVCPLQVGEEDDGLGWDSSCNSDNDNDDDGYTYHLQPRTVMKETDECKEDDPGEDYKADIPETSQERILLCGAPCVENEDLQVPPLVELFAKGVKDDSYASRCQHEQTGHDVSGRNEHGQGEGGVRHHVEKDNTPDNEASILSGGPNEAGILQGGPNEAGLPQGGPNEAGIPQGGPNEAGIPQGGLNEAGIPQGGPNEASILQGGPNEAGRIPEGGPDEADSPQGGPNEADSPQGGQNQNQDEQGGNNASPPSGQGSSGSNGPNQPDLGGSGGDYEDSGYGSGSTEFCQRIVVPQCRATVLLLGHINAGKTCLIDTLIGAPFRDPKEVGGNEESTEDESELSNCHVTSTHAQATHLDWKRLEQPLRDKISKEHSDAVQSELQQPSRRRELGQTSTEDRHENAQDMTTSLEFVDMSGEFVFYKLHQMFLAQSMVFLLVMDVMKDLDSNILADSHISQRWKGKIDCPNTPRKFLSCWLNNISSFLDGHSKKSIIIVLTHTDLLDDDIRDEGIKHFKKQVLSHIENHPAAKLVEKNAVFAISNKRREISRQEVDNLRICILWLAKNKETFGIAKPCTWFKMSLEIIDSEQNHMTVTELREMAGRLGMSRREMQDFITFEEQHGRILVAEDNVDLVVTERQYLIDKFKLIVAMWESRRTSQVSLDKVGQLKKDLDDGTFSLLNLRIIWHLGNDSDVENLASIFSKSYVFIPWKQTDVTTKYIVPALLPPVGDPDPDLVGREGTRTLVYFFSHLTDRRRVTSSGFLPTGFIPRLLKLLFKEQELNWETSEIYCNGACFEIGFNREILLTLSSEGSTVRLQALTLPEAQSENIDSNISDARCQFDDAIKYLLRTRYPNISCHVCISPCHSSSHINLDNYPCLQILGKLGEVAIKALPSSVSCKRHEEKKTLTSKEYKSWFYNECKQHGAQSLFNKGDEKILNEIAKSVANCGMLESIGIELGVDAVKIEQCYNDAHRQLKPGALNVLLAWYKSCTLEGSLKTPGSPIYNLLKQATDKAGLKYPS